MRVAPIAAAVLLAGCTGHLEFDPFAGAVDDGGAASTTAVPNAPATNDKGGMMTGGAGGAGGTAAASPTPPPADARPEPADALPAPTVADASPAATNTGGWDGGSGYGASAAGGSDGGTPSPASADAAPASASSGCPTGFNVPDLFVKRCGGCHSATAPAKGLDMVTTNLAARVVNIKSTCNNKLLLGTTTPPAGHFLDKLAGSVAGCGVQMPYGAAALTATEMACVRDWAVQAINKVTGR